MATKGKKGLKQKSFPYYMQHNHYSKFSTFQKALSAAVRDVLKSPRLKAGEIIARNGKKLVAVARRVERGQIEVLYTSKQLNSYRSPNGRRLAKVVPLKVVNGQ